MRYLPLLLALLALPASAEIYSHVDAQGNRVFTDRPQGDAPPVRLSPTNRMPASAVSPPAAASRPAPRPRQPGYHWLRILDPEADATVRDASGALTVTVASDPDLRPGHSYRLLLDGSATGPAGPQAVFHLENLDRGTHQLAVEILDADGKRLELSTEQAVHIKRPSLAQKRLARPCQYADYGVRPECPLQDRPARRWSWNIPFL